MPFTALTSLEDQISQIKSIVEINEEVRNSISNDSHPVSTPIDELYWRRYDYCSAILRLYSSFERFIIDSLQKWLDWIVKNKLPILSQSDKAISRYRYGVGEILKRSTESRFSKINITALVNSLTALHNNQDTHLGIDPIFATSPNLRFNDVISALESLELIGASEWLNAFPPLKEGCETSDTTPEKFLKELVDRRNEAAHGNKMPDEFWSVTLIKDAASLVLSLATAIAEFIVYNMICIVERNPIINGNKLELPNIGKIGEVFKKHNAFVICANKTGLWKGMKILVVTNMRCYIDILVSIQLNGNSACAWMATKNEEIGLCTEILPHKSARLYSLDEMVCFQ